MIGPVRRGYVIFATLILSTMSKDLSNLGNEISAAVQRRVAPLHNLGARITERVNRNIALHNPLYASEYYGGFYHSAPDVYANNLNYHIQKSLDEELAPLQNLGQQIQESVNKGLEPVRAMEVTYQMQSGVGGITIATYLPSGKQLIIDNYLTYQCSDNIDVNTGKCAGDLTPFIVSKQQDYCFRTTSYSIINNYICLGASTVSVINNRFKCENFSNQPVLIMNLDDFKKMCEGVTAVQYRYIADQSNPYHVEIPNRNPHVKCENNERGVCVFTQNLAYNGNSRVVINNHYSYNQYGY